MPLSGTRRLSQTTRSPNPNVTPRVNENTGLARTAMVVGKARARNGRIATQNRTSPLPPRGGRRAANRNARKAILKANQSESVKNQKLVMTTARGRRRRRIGRRNGSVGGHSQSPRNRKPKNNPRTIPRPLLPILIPNRIDPPGARVLPSQS